MYYICTISRHSNLTPEQFKFYTVHNDVLKYDMNFSRFELDKDGHIFSSNLLKREQAQKVFEVVKGIVGVNNIFSGASDYNGPIVQEDIIGKRVNVEKYGPGTIMTVENLRSVRYGVKLDNPSIFDDWFKLYGSYPHFWESDLKFNDFI